MGKGFTMPNVQGRDLADMFHEAFKRKVNFYRVPPTTGKGVNDYLRHLNCAVRILTSVSVRY